MGKGVQKGSCEMLYRVYRKCPVRYCNAWLSHHWMLCSLGTLPVSEIRNIHFFGATFFTLVF